MNILVANFSLDKVGGSETFTFTLIEELIKRKHNVEYFTFHQGYVSHKIEKDLGVSFMTKKKYDLVLANHNKIIKKVYFKGFTIQTCHGIYPELEQPSHYADSHVSISTEVQNYLANKGYSSRLIFNGINCKRYTVKNKVSNQLSKVLSLCHSDSANDKLKRICKDLQVDLRIADKYNDPVWNIEDSINDVDLVVGLGRSAYEAMACGRPVIVWDDRDYFNSVGDGYVRDLLGLSMLNNCSGRYSKKEYSDEELKLEFEKYNSEDSKFFRDFALNKLNVEKAVDEYIEYYTNLLKEKSNLNFRQKTERFIGKKLLKIAGTIKSDFRQRKKK